MGFRASDLIRHFYKFASKIIYHICKVSKILSFPRERNKNKIK